MKSVSVLVVVICCALSAVAVETPAQLGVRFSDAFTAFAPLGLFHRAYSDHLFQGTPVVVPDGTATACDATALELANLHLAILTQTASDVSVSIPLIASLRATLANACAVWGPTLDTLARSAPLDQDLLQQASDGGLFAEIHDLQDRMQHLLDAFLEGIGQDEAVWQFGVAFSMQSMLAKENVEQIDGAVHEILYGSPEGSAPPAFVSADVAAMLEELVALSGRPLEEEDAARALELASGVLEFLLDGS